MHPVPGTPIALCRRCGRLPAANVGHEPREVRRSGRVRRRPLWGHVVAATEKLVRSPRGCSSKEDGLRRRVKTACGVRKTAGGGHSNLNLDFEIKLDLDPEYILGVTRGQIDPYHTIIYIRGHIMGDKG